MSLPEPDSIHLRRFEEQDMVVLTLLCNNRKIWNNVRDALPSPYTEEHALEFIRKCQKETPATTFAIGYKGQLAGCISLIMQEDVYRLSAEAGYWIGEPYWGLGIATRALNLLTEYGFDELGLIRIYSGVFAFNTASRKVLEKCGFQLEGIFKNSVIKNGSVCDELRFAKLR